MVMHPANALTPINNSITYPVIKNFYHDKRIAFVEPTFTYAAYQNGSFYNFYDKYSKTRFSNENITVTNDLNLLKDRPVPHGPFPYFEHPTYKDIPYKYYFDILYQHVNKTNANITKLTDADVHLGKIFQADGKNAYDILFLFHQEYVTQTEYNNLKQFVSNGGTIVFDEANLFYAEVSYNKTKDTINLVSGHAWNFDGKLAKAGPNERWLNESKDWMGSNFLHINSDLQVLFKNNPFNYTHLEEQYVTNPKAVILINYHAYNLTRDYPNATVATYMMNYGKGKVINLGIWGHALTDNKNFINYFDNVIIPLALNQTSLLNQELLYNYAKSTSTEAEKCSNYDSKLNIITVSCDTTLSGIYHDVNKRTVLEKNPNGEWILNAVIKVNPLAKLTINKSDTSWLKITNKNATEPNFISISGSANIDGVKITSWDPPSNNTIKQYVNGSIPRPYILAVKAVGNVDISNSELAYLGNNSYPSNGLVYSKGGNGSSIINNTFHDMWDGFYSDSVGFITIKNNIYYNNLRMGADPHSGSHDLNISRNLAYNNGIAGIACSVSCYNILFENNTVHNNGKTGLEFSLQTNNSTARNNYAYSEKEGISIYSSSNDKVYDNMLNSNNKGIAIGGNSSNNMIYNNTLGNNGIAIDFADQPKNNLVKDNYASNAFIPPFKQP